MTAWAASPSTPLGTDRVSEPSEPVYTLVFAIGLLQGQRDRDELELEDRLQDDVDHRPAGDLVVARGGHREVEADQRLVDQHAREKAADRPLQRSPDALVVELADEGRADAAHPGLREVDDAAGRDALKRTVV